ncbi:MAG: hypothetical protein PHE49_11080 [bacterium]|nr:hypothetical protein [bacterium]
MKKGILFILVTFLFGGCANRHHIKQEQASQDTTQTQAIQDTTQSQVISEQPTPEQVTQEQASQEQITQEQKPQEQVVPDTTQTQVTQEQPKQQPKRKLTKEEKIKQEQLKKQEEAQALQEAYNKFVIEENAKQDEIYWLSDSLPEEIYYPMTDRKRAQTILKKPRLVSMTTPHFIDYPYYRLAWEIKGSNPTKTYIRIVIKLYDINQNLLEEESTEMLVYPDRQNLFYLDFEKTPKDKVCYVKILIPW